MERIRESFERQGFMRTLGASLDSVESGTVTITCAFDERMTQQHGLMHGGVLASVTDLQWNVAGVGDYDGDGQADVLWRHATLGHDDLWRSADSSRRLPLARVADVDWRVMR